MSTRTAICSCGRLSAVCAGDPALVSLCHCTECQKRTGSPFGIAAFFLRERVTAEGPSTRFTRQSDSGFPVTFHFCSNCGSTVFWEPKRKPDMIAVAVGAFADPDFPAPSKEANVEFGHAWVKHDI